MNNMIFILSNAAILLSNTKIVGLQYNPTHEKDVGKFLQLMTNGCISSIYSSCAMQYASQSGTLFINFKYALYMYNYHIHSLKLYTIYL